MRRFKGFTLSEVMVALAVIGVLVAVVTPAIMKTKPNKNKMMVKKTFYSVEQIVSSLINDAKLYPDYTDGCDDGDATTVCYYGFDDTTATSYEGTSYSGDDKFRGLFKAKLNVSRTDSDNDYIFYTNDGVKWDLSDTKGWSQGDANDLKPIKIDVNGDEAPNCRQHDTGCSANNFDQYVINIHTNGKLGIDNDEDTGDTEAQKYIEINTSLRN